MENRELRVIEFNLQQSACYELPFLNAVKCSSPRSVVLGGVGPAPRGGMQVRVVDQRPGIAPEEHAAEQSRTRGH